MTEKEKFEEAKRLYQTANADQRYVLETLFPELHESEDERIRKELIEYIKDQQSSFISPPDCRDKYEEEENNKYNSWIVWLEKQGEQKTADNVEPKFKAGDWIISKYMHLVMQILNNDNGSYKTVETDGTERNDSYDFIERNFKLWTIQDAKDGDVLFMDNGSANCIFIYKSFNNGTINKYASYNNFGFEGEHYLVLNDGYAIPATKEQRDLLLQKMKEAGYE